MGTSQSHPIFLALQELLLSKNLKIKKSTLERFLNECNTVAPWFAVYGSLTVACWDRLGKDLDLAWDQGTLKGGVKPIWKLVRGCLEDKKCCKAVEDGQTALEILQEERSEKAESVKEKGAKSLYPASEGLGDFSSEDPDLEEEEIHALVEQLEGASLKQRKKLRDKSGVAAPSMGVAVPTLPAPSTPTPHLETTQYTGSSFCPQIWSQVRTKLSLAYPVFQDPQGQRSHEPLDFKVIKSLAEPVRNYGTSTAFMVAQVEALTRHCMTPRDWSSLVRAFLSPGQYLDWSIPYRICN